MGECRPDQYEVSAPTLILDRVCANLTVCDPNNEVEEVRPTSTTDRICRMIATGIPDIVDGSGDDSSDDSRETLIIGMWIILFVILIMAVLLGLWLCRRKKKDKKKRTALITGASKKKKDMFSSFPTEPVVVDRTQSTPRELHTSATSPRSPVVDYTPYQVPAAPFSPSSTSSPPRVASPQDRRVEEVPRTRMVAWADETSPMTSPTPIGPTVDLEPVTQSTVLKRRQESLRLKKSEKDRGYFSRDNAEVVNGLLIFWRLTVE